MDRALNGVEVPVYHFGAVVGTRRVYNDRLLMFILRNRAPTRFAADSLVNADAATRSHLDRLKRDWRAQWEEEHLSQRAETAGQTSDKLTAKLETMHQRWLAAMTKPTRALYEAYKAAEAEDQAAHRTVWTEELEEREARDEEEEGAAACEAEERPSAAPDAADAKAESVLPGARPAAAPARQ